MALGRTSTRRVLETVGARTARWSVVVPLKPLELAKTRLHELPTPLRRALVVGMALDVRDAVLGCCLVEELIVVSRDPRWRTILAGPRMRFLPDSPDDSLNDALRRGAAVCRRGLPDHGIAALTADLPALTSAELGAALGQASADRSSFVPDAAGEGTTLLAARPSSRFNPHYGAVSRLRHRHAGATELGFPRGSGLRQDVDTLDDLADAQAIGVGHHTRAVLAAAMEPVPLFPAHFFDRRAVKPPLPLTCRDLAPPCSRG